MPLVEEKFDQHKIDSLKRYLLRERENNRIKDFEIIVDSFKVVSRTNNIEEFEDYEQEIKENTRNLSILIFDGPETPRNTRYSFSLGDAISRNSQPANGLGEIDQVIAQKLEEHERVHELNRLKEQLSATKEQLTEAEEYAYSLEKRIKSMEEKRYTQAVSLGEVASVVLKSLVRQHASKIPGGQALAGLLGADDVDTSTTPSIPLANESSVSFEKKSDTEPITEETRNRLSLIGQMQERFTESQMIAVFSIIDCMAADPSKITEVLTLLHLQPTTGE